MLGGANMCEVFLWDILFGGALVLAYRNLSDQVQCCPTSNIFSTNPQGNPPPVNSINLKIFPVNFQMFKESPRKLPDI